MPRRASRRSKKEGPPGFLILCQRTCRIGIHGYVNQTGSGADRLINAFWYTVEDHGCSSPTIEAITCLVLKEIRIIDFFLFQFGLSPYDRHYNRSYCIRWVRCFLYSPFAMASNQDPNSMTIFCTCSETIILQATKINATVYCCEEIRCWVHSHASTKCYWCF